MPNPRMFIYESLIMFAQLLFAALVLSQWFVSGRIGTARSRLERTFAAWTAGITAALLAVAALASFAPTSTFLLVIDTISGVSLLIHLVGTGVIRVMAHRKSRKATAILR